MTCARCGLEFKPFELIIEGRHKDAEFCVGLLKFELRRVTLRAHALIQEVRKAGQREDERGVHEQRARYEEHVTHFALHGIEDPGL